MTLLHPDLDKCHSYLTYHLADKEKYVPPARRGMPFITISREAGAGGHSLSELLHGYLDMKCPLPESDWTVFDKDLVQAAMEEHGLPQRFGKYLAEKRVSEIKSLIGDCYDRYLVRMEEIRQSASIVQQVIETIPEGPYFAEDAKKIFPDTKEKIMSSMGELIQNFMITTQGPQMPAGEVYLEAENPNVRGALSVGFIETLPETELNELGSKIDAGEVDTIVVYNEDLTVAGISSEQLAKVKVVYFGTHSHSTAEAAQVVIPTLSVFEKQGTFINQQFRLQKFLETAPGPTGVADDLESLSQLLNHVGPDTGALGSVNKIWSELSKEVSMFNDLSFGTLSPEGFLLDGSAFTHLKFCEGKTLHYSPAAETVEVET